MYFTEKGKKKVSFTPSEKEILEITHDFLYSKRTGKLFGYLEGKPTRKDRAHAKQPHGFLGQTSCAEWAQLRAECYSERESRTEPLRGT